MNSIVLGYSHRQKRAFTLTEIAIVLGVVGLVLGAIWAAAASVYENLKVSEASQGITTTAQGVRTLYGSSASTGLTSTASIVVPGLFPVSWVSGGIYGNPWNQKPSANMSYIYGNGTSFQIELDGLDASGCSALIGFFGSTASSANGGQIVGLTGSAVSTGAVTPGTAKIGATMTAAGTYAAPAACSGANGSNSLAITFNMNAM